ncbi:acyltransferase [Bacillus sp. CECT 9360]|uniref:acyltransferase n=1 Tax=Bacillus sp. CECT 9360 TaxID=2845821 RepID=UPI001E508916|nr:acyltransferase [Bacillus sp. CECT 9360]CAH0345157.1 putative poly-beta-1,6-N-acetyl-D-glucosamine export protein [Bacillus sp. CECT 9360]
MKNPSAYIYEIHYLRAVACLFVLLVHVSAAFSNQQGRFNDFTFFINQISRFGTPLFAVISGFLLFYQVRKKGFNIKKFLSSRVTKIGMPFMFWSIFYLLFMFVMEDVNPFLIGENEFLINFAAGESFYHLYFMSLVFQFYLIFLVLQLFRSKISWFLLLILSILANVYFLTGFDPTHFKGLWQFALSKRAFLPNWIFFFVFGGFLAYYWEGLYSFSRKYRKALAIMSIIVTILAVYEYKAVGSIPSNRVSNIINIPLLTLFIIGMGDKINQVNWLKKTLTKIGTLSMAIYLVHPLVLYLIQEIAPPVIWQTRFFPVVFLIILGTTIAVVNLIQLFPKNEYILTLPKIKNRNSTKEEVRAIA